jgi:hypothetical protein
MKNITCSETDGFDEPCVVRTQLVSGRRRASVFIDHSRVNHTRHAHMRHEYVMSVGLVVEDKRPNTHGCVSIELWV